MAIGEELQDVALELQEEVGPNVGDDIAIVWRSGAREAVVSGGAGVDKYGARVSQSGATAPSHLRATLAGIYYCRRAHNAEGGAQAFGGQLVNALPWVVVFNENQNPRVEANSTITICVKREAAQTIAELGWRANTIYALGDREMSANTAALLDPNRRMVYEVQSGGQSGVSEPVWPTQKLATVVDGGIIWRCVGRLDEYEVKDPGGQDTIPVERVVGCIQVTS